MKQSLVEQITRVLGKVPMVKNLARRKFICQFIVGLIKSRNVQFCEVAHHLNGSAKLTSNEVRIQDFFREADLDYGFVAVLPCFQAFKERGFDLEKTHLKDFSKLKKLVAMVSLAYSICISMGIYIHRKVQKIKTRNHGYKSNSFCRKGIDTIREVFRSEQLMPGWMINRVKALLRWIIIQATRYQPTTIAG